MKQLKHVPKLCCVPKRGYLSSSHPRGLASRRQPSQDETAPLCSNLETTVINHGTNPRKDSSDAFQLRL